MRQGRIAVGLCLPALLAVAWLFGVHAGPSSAAVAPGSADLALTKSDSPDPVTAGAALTYTIQVVNAGPDAAANVVVIDDLPKGVGFVSAQSTQGTCGVSANGRKVTCTLGTVGVTVGPQYNPTPVTITIGVLAPTGVGKKGQTISNKASLDSDTKDPKRGNDRATASTRVVEPTPIACSGAAATIVGTAGADLLYGSAGDDVVFSGAGDDRILTFGGRDLVCAGAGGDVVKSGAKGDRVLAGPGPDRIAGGVGGDVLRGAGGRDLLRGGLGPDLLAGGLGRDLCFGGPGNDLLRSCRR